MYHFKFLTHDLSTYNKSNARRLNNPASKCGQGTPLTVNELEHY